MCKIETETKTDTRIDCLIGGYTLGIFYYYLFITDQCCSALTCCCLKIKSRSTVNEPLLPLRKFNLDFWLKLQMTKNSVCTLTGTLYI